jgi:Kdo2-lipid IVA lauroyltransferase/acyltransferase
VAKSARLRTVRDYTLSVGLAGMLWLGFLLPYRIRVRSLGWISGRLIAPMVGFRRIIRQNLALVRPDLPAKEVERIARAVPDNATRTLIEIFSGEEFLRVAEQSEIHGAEGFAALEAAHAAGRGVILVSGHFGNYDVPRGVLSRRGYRVGGLYRPMDNRFFNPRYVAAISRISQPVFPRGRRGLGEMVRFLRGGGMVGMLIDQRMRHGAPLNFFGHTAFTALSAAEMALKYDALVVPVYGRRRPDGLSFDLVIEPPIPHTTPEEMTQRLNDSLERQVRGHMDQWLWLHERWKPIKRRRKRQAGKTGADKAPPAGQS